MYHHPAPGTAMEVAMQANDTTCPVAIPGYIYIIKADDRYKIGKARQLGSRLDTHSSSSPYPIELIAQEHVADYSGVEHLLHRLFKDKEVKPEWFHLTQDDLEAALDVLAQHTLDQEPREGDNDSGVWLTYVEATRRLGKTEPAIRQQAIRGRWPRRRNQFGRVEVRVPIRETDEPVDPVAQLFRAHIQRIEEQAETIAQLRIDLEALRRDLRSLEAQRDGLSVTLAKLNGTWPKEDEA
jgi:hypothetical protein